MTRSNSNCARSHRRSTLPVRSEASQSAAGCRSTGRRREAELGAALEQAWLRVRRSSSGTRRSKRDSRRSWRRQRHTSPNGRLAVRSPVDGRGSGSPHASRGSGGRRSSARGEQTAARRTDPAARVTRRRRSKRPGRLPRQTPTLAPSASGSAKRHCRNNLGSHDRAECARNAVDRDRECIAAREARRECGRDVPRHSRPRRRERSSPNARPFPISALSEAAAAAADRLAGREAELGVTIADTVAARDALVQDARRRGEGAVRRPRARRRGTVRRRAPGGAVQTAFEVRLSGEAAARRTLEESLRDAEVGARRSAAHIETGRGCARRDDKSSATSGAGRRDSRRRRTTVGSVGRARGHASAVAEAAAATDLLDGAKRELARAGTIAGRDGIAQRRMPRPRSTTDAAREAAQRRRSSQTRLAR